MQFMIYLLLALGLSVVVQAFIDAWSRLVAWWRRRREASALASTFKNANLFPHQRRFLDTCETCGRGGNDPTERS
jgi:predicted permease